MPFVKCRADFYHGLIAAVAGVLLEVGIEAQELGQIRGGFVCPGFEQANYISLYWGDEDANLLAELSREEFEELQREMVQAAQAASLSAQSRMPGRETVLRRSK